MRADTPAQLNRSTLGSWSTAKDAAKDVGAESSTLELELGRMTEAVSVWWLAPMLGDGEDCNTDSCEVAVQVLCTANATAAAAVTTTTHLTPGLVSFFTTAPGWNASRVTTLPEVYKVGDSVHLALTSPPDNLFEGYCGDRSSIRFTVTVRVSNGMVGQYGAFYGSGEGPSNALSFQVAADGGSVTSVTGIVEQPGRHHIQLSAQDLSNARVPVAGWVFDSVGFRVSSNWDENANGQNANLPDFAATLYTDRSYTSGPLPASAVVFEDARGALSDIRYEVVFAGRGAYITRVSVDSTNGQVRICSMVEIYVPLVALSTVAALCRVVRGVYPIPCWRVGVLACTSISISLSLSLSLSLSRSTHTHTRTHLSDARYMWKGSLRA